MELPLGQAEIVLLIALREYKSRVWFGDEQMLTSLRGMV